MQGIDDSVADDMDLLIRNAVCQQVAARDHRRRQMHASDLRDDLAIRLFWEWRADVTASKPRLQLPHRNLAVECRNRGSHDCRRVTVHDYRVGSVLFEDGVDL